MKKDLPEAEVLIINTNSRSVSSSKAEKKVKKAVAILKEFKADYYYKKIDSTLRGNIGAELDAVIEELGVERIPLCAAFPEMGRKTINAVHYLGDDKITETDFARDISSPVEEANIKKLLEGQMRNPSAVDVLDASTESDLKKLSEDNKGTVFAGAAAWAGALAENWVASSRKVYPMVISPGPVMAVSGSLNPVSKKQTDYWEKLGFTSVFPSEKTEESSNLLVKTFPEDTSGALKKLSRYAASLWKKEKWNRVILNGGDTAYGFVEYLDIEYLNIVKSIAPGVAVTRCPEGYFILKPGGYGREDTLTELAASLGGRG